MIKTNSNGVSADILKLIAIVAMLIDHIAWAFVPLDTFLGFTMHVIGRLTAPIMCFFIAEGFHHTRNVKKYALRLLIFAIISQIPFFYFETGRFIPEFNSFFDILGKFNVIFTLLFGLLSLWILKSSMKSAVKYLLILILMIVSLASDWLFFGILFILVFGLNSGNFKKQATGFSLISLVLLINFLFNMSYLMLFQLGVLLALPLLYFYNGERSGNRMNKWVFYWFYPVHLLIIGLMKFYILK